MASNSRPFQQIRVLLSMTSSVRAMWFTPAFASLLEKRGETFALVGAGAAHLTLSLAGLPAWSCPIRAATGIPCPGCGLTLATMEFLRGDLSASFRTHAFAPVFLAALALMLAALVLPEGPRTRLVRSISNVEQGSGITAWVMLLLFLYWGVRLPGLI